MSGWTNTKPTEPGVYGVKGFNLGQTPSEQVEAIVRVVFDGELVCNLHQCNSEEDFEDWYAVSDLLDTFEWRKYELVL